MSEYTLMGFSGAGVVGAGALALAFGAEVGGYIALAVGIFIILTAVVGAWFQSD